MKIKTRSEETNINERAPKNLKDTSDKIKSCKPRKIKHITCNKMQQTQKPIK